VTPGEVFTHTGQAPRRLVAYACLEMGGALLPFLQLGSRVEGPCFELVEPVGEGLRRIVLGQAEVPALILVHGTSFL